AGRVCLLAAAGGRTAGPRAAAEAPIVAAVYPPLVWICAYALSEAMYATVALAGVWALGRVTDGRTGTGFNPVPAASGERGTPLAWLVSAGALAGLAALTRPAHLFFLPLAALLIVWR